MLLPWLGGFLFNSGTLSCLKWTLLTRLACIFLVTSDGSIPCGFTRDTSIKVWGSHKCTTQPHSTTTCQSFIHTYTHIHYNIKWFVQTYTHTHSCNRWSNKHIHSVCHPPPTPLWWDDHVSSTWYSITTRGTYQPSLLSYDEVNAPPHPTQLQHDEHNTMTYPHLVVTRQMWLVYNPPPF